MAYSSGFHPHPRISYAGAAPTGSASEAEYLEIGLAEVVDPADVAAALAEALPDGLDVLRSWSRPAARWPTCSTASRWTIRLPAGPGRPLGPWRAFLAADAVPVERMTKKGLREFDCRAAVVSLRRRRTADGHAGARPRAAPHRARGPPRRRAHRAGAGRRGRGSAAAGGERPVPLMTRWPQGPLDESTGRVGDPLAASA